MTCCCAGFSLIIACKYRPLPILKQALCVLAPSSPFVVYREYLEPLTECFLHLQQAGTALRMVLSDTWMREFQTLPGRFRPAMFMSTSGGFVLSGIYVGNSGIMPVGKSEEAVSSGSDDIEKYTSKN